MRLRDRLYLYLVNNYDKDANYAIAHYLLQNINHISDISIYTVSRECNVSQATVSRFCRKMGYEDFITFRDECETERITGGVAKLPHVGKELALSDADSLHKTMARYACEVEKSLAQISEHKLNELVQDIKRYDHVYLFGISNTSLIAGHIQMHLGLWDKFCERYTGVPYNGMEVDRKNSLAILFAMHGYVVKTDPKLIRFIQSGFDKSWEVSQVDEKGCLDRVLFLGKCEEITADYMAWIYLSELIVSRYQQMIS